MEALGCGRDMSMGNRARAMGRNLLGRRRSCLGIQSATASSKLYL